MPVHDYRRRAPGRRLDAMATALVESWRQRGSLDARGENKTGFSGLLCTFKPSDMPPSGSSGHRVQITKPLALRTISQFRAMPINTGAGLSGHLKSHVVGAVRSASVEADGIHIQGVLWDKNMPGAIANIKAHERLLGLSFEASDIQVADESADVWVLTDLEWTGCSILLKRAAAFSSSWIKLD